MPNYGGMEAYDRMKRTCRTASSWFERASAIAQHTKLPQAEPDFTLVGYEVEQMLYRVLRDADMLVPLLNRSALVDGEIEGYAKELASLLRKRRLAEAMENTSGRTEEEKAAFAAARERLRS